MRQYLIEGSWPQIDGGCRHLVETTDGHQITVDEGESGKLSGFVRGHCSDHEERVLLRGAFRALEREAREGFLS